MTSTLEQIAFRVNTAQVAALTCSLLLYPPHTEERIAHAKREADKAKAVTGNALALLREENDVVDPQTTIYHVSPDLLDTPANRALLLALDAALAAADIVNVERQSSASNSLLTKRLRELRDRVLLEIQSVHNVEASR